LLGPTLKKDELLELVLAHNMEMGRFGSVLYTCLHKERLISVRVRKQKGVSNGEGGVEHV
jgi:hypothetical protein